MDGEAGTTVADRSTAAVGVANEGAEEPPAALQEGATTDGPTDDQTGDESEEQAAGEGEEGPQDGSADSPKTPAPTESDGEPPGSTPDEPDGGSEAADSLQAADERPTGATTRPKPEAAGTARAETVAGPAKPDAGTTATRRSGAEGQAAGTPAATPPPARKPRPRAPELHSGHKLARRYQLAECVTRVDGFSSWRAVDEKLRRAVGIHILPSGHQRARSVIAAARSAALLGDPRFVQVLDAVEEDDLVYVIHEWLPDALSLGELLAAGPLDPHEAHQMVSQVSQAMAAAHREGLAHLKLDPGAVLRTSSGQYRIRGLAVTAALRGLTTERPAQQDTEAVGALLYASLTQRWPYEEDAHGLAGLPKGVGLIAPDQVRAGIHRGLSEIAMRALANDGATASREEPPCTTPEELAKAVAAIPRIRPVEHTPSAYAVPAFAQAPQPPLGAPRQPVAPPQPLPPALPGRTGRILKSVVGAIVVAAIGLASWQLADALKSREDHPAHRSTASGGGSQSAPAKPASHPVKIAGAKDFDPYSRDREENPKQVPAAVDGNPATYWETSWYTNAKFGGLKPGVGLILDLGSTQRVGTVTVDFIGTTSVDLLAAGKDAGTMPTSFDDFTKVASGSGTQVKLTPQSAVNSRYLLVWLTNLPPTDQGNYRGRVTEINVTS